MTRRRAIALVPIAALCAGLLLAPGAAAKKGKNTDVFAQQLTVNAPIPDHAAGMAAPPSTPVLSTIQVPKKFKGRTVADVDVTALQTTGSTATSASQLVAYLIAPNGRTLQLFVGVGGQSLGPWTLNDETPVAICNTAPPATCTDPSQSLRQPFFGTSNLTQNWIGFFPVNGNLTLFDGIGMRGTWTLRIADRANAGLSTLNQWGLRIRAKAAK